MDYPKLVGTHCRLALFLSEYSNGTSEKPWTLLDIYTSPLGHVLKMLEVRLPIASQTDDPLCPQAQKHTYITTGHCNAALGAISQIDPNDPILDNSIEDLMITGRPSSYHEDTADSLFFVLAEAGVYIPCSYANDDWDTRRQIMHELRPSSGPIFWNRDFPDPDTGTPPTIVPIGSLTFGQLFRQSAFEVKNRTLGTWRALQRVKRLGILRHSVDKLLRGDPTDGHDPIIYTTSTGNRKCCECSGAQAGHCVDSGPSLPYLYCEELPAGGCNSQSDPCPGCD